MGSHYTSSSFFYNNILYILCFEHNCMYIVTLYMSDRKSDITMYLRCLLSDACAARRIDTCVYMYILSFNRYIAI